MDSEQDAGDLAVWQWSADFPRPTAEEIETARAQQAALAAVPLVCLDDLVPGHPLYSQLAPSMVEYWRAEGFTKVYIPPAVPPEDGSHGTPLTRDELEEHYGQLLRRRARPHRR